MKTNELTEALASIAPNRTEAEHVRAVGRMIMDMEAEGDIVPRPKWTRRVCESSSKSTKSEARK